ncbi:MAG TPA: ABC transporter permease, partial [Ktedonobacterales bacterium]|nr:ABC transporter permease [Ktedonobacterales bacterium]
MRLIGRASLRKSLTDVTRRKGRTLLVVLGIFIGVFGLTAINFTDDTLVSAFAFTRGYQATQPDFQMTVDRLDPVLRPALQAASNVKAVQYVSSFSACWQPANTGCNVSMDIFSSPDLQHIPITPFQLTAGRYPGTGEIVMEQGDQSLHGVNIGDIVTLHAGGQTGQVRVVGLARTPGANPTNTGDALAYMSDAGLQQVVTALGNPVDTGPGGQQLARYQHHIQVTFQSTNPQLESTAVTALLHAVQAHGV